MAGICRSVDTHRLQYFLRIAEEGSITAAAGLLGIAQPALSRQLQLLEEDLGVSLFRRTRRGVELTDAGERLRASTAGPLRQLDLAVQYVASPLARLERTMCLGLPETAVDVLAAPLISSLSVAFPNARFSMTAGNTDTLVEAMLKGAVDAALISPVPDERVFYREMLQEDLILVGSHQCELDPTLPIPFADAVRRPLVIPRSPSGIATTLHNAALRTKVNIDYRTTTDSLYVTKALIEAGLCYGVLPLSACQRDVDEGRLRYAPITDPDLTVQLGVAATAQLDLPREFVAKVGNTIREEVDALVKTGRWPARFLSPAPWNPRYG